MFVILTIDWNATAAWIALAVAILSPVITTWLNNKHQLKLRKLDSEQSRIHEINLARNNAIASFISDTGRCLSHANIESKQGLGSSYHNVYAYVPNELWDDLDNLYELICSHNWNDAQDAFSPIVRELALLLKEPLQ